MKVATVLVALLLAALAGAALVSGAVAAPPWDDEARERWAQRLAFAVPVLAARRLGAGCRKLERRCEVLPGDSSGRLTLRLVRAGGKVALGFEPRGKDAVAFSVELSSGEQARLTIPEAGAVLTLRRACRATDQPPCELALEPGPQSSRSGKPPSDAAQ